MRDQNRNRAADDISVRSSNAIIRPASRCAICGIVEFDSSAERKVEQTVLQFEQPLPDAVYAKRLPGAGKEQDHQRQDDQNLEGMEKSRWSYRTFRARG